MFYIKQIALLIQTLSVPVWKTVLWEWDWAEQGKCQKWLGSVRIPELQASQWSTGKEGTLLQRLGGFAGVFTPTAALAAQPGLGWGITCTGDGSTVPHRLGWLPSLVRCFWISLNLKPGQLKGESVWNIHKGEVKFCAVPRAFLRHFWYISEVVSP